MPGLVAATNQLNTDNTALAPAQAAVVTAQQAVTTIMTAVTTDDAAVVAALTSGPSPAFVGPLPDGTINVYTLDPTQPAGFAVVNVAPGT